MIPHVGDYADRDTVVSTCDAIIRLDGTSYPTAILAPGKGVQVTFMTTDKDVATMKLRSMGRKPVTVYSENYPTTAVQRKCPNCGWIVSNPDCMRCKK